jgi:hypothetical protein
MRAEKPSIAPLRGRPPAAVRSALARGAIPGYDIGIIETDILTCNLEHLEAQPGPTA